MGCCPGCGEWNCLEEEVRKPQASGVTAAHTAAQTLAEIPDDTEHRCDTGMKELNRVLGGGLVKGSVVLLGGDPGIGKSTLLLQLCQTIAPPHPADPPLSILYVSGEESAHQIKLRARRLQVTSPTLRILCETDADSVCAHMKEEKPDFVIIDSIQTMQIRDVGASPGSVTQVRESTNMLQRSAKALDIPLFLVGHVNKDGNIAGPKVLEHIVDAVLYFEGERNYNYRILRAAKNRYGSTNEIGVFEMLDAGLREVENPSAALIAGRPKGVSGACVACVMEGSRPILAEVQGLVSPTGFGTPRRLANGVDSYRCAMLIAVLEKRAGYFFGQMDTYLNVVGGLKLDEPGTDLSVAMALVSGLKDMALPHDALIFGEVGLGGEIRAVGHCEQRVKEAARLGFTRCVVPKGNFEKLPENIRGLMRVVGVSRVREAFAALTA
jgi:DNA repair protein RadA/Sms